MIRTSKLLLEDTTVTVDKDGNESQKKKYTQILVETEPNYIKLYINTLLAFRDLPKTMNPLLTELLGLMSYASPTSKYGGQVIVLSRLIREDIAEKLDIKVNTIAKSITELCKSGILKRLGTNMYQVNPSLFGKGDWKDIKAIRATFDFNKGTVEAEFDDTL